MGTKRTSWLACVLEVNNTFLHIVCIWALCEDKFVYLHLHHLTLIVMNIFSRSCYWQSSHPYPYYFCYFYWKSSSSLQSCLLHCHTRGSFNWLQQQVTQWYKYVCFIFHLDFICASYFYVPVIYSLMV